MSDIEELHNALAERDNLRNFAREIMDCWPHGDVDGGHLQDLANKHGLLTQEVRHRPCGKNSDVCPCMDLISEAEFEDGASCFRKVDWLLKQGE